MKTYVSWRLHILCIMFKIRYRSIVTLAEFNIWYTGYYSPIVKPTKISTIAPFNTSNLRTLSSRLSSLCFLSSRWNLLTSRFIRLGLWPFPSQILPSDLSGLIVLPNTTRYFVLYSEHTTLFPPFQIGRVLISGWNCIGLSCLPKAFIYLASNTADGLSAFFRVFLYLQICFHNFSVNHMY